MDHFDLVVTGGGIVGCAAAVAAARSGARVLLLDRRSYLGWEWTATRMPRIDRSGLSAVCEVFGDVFGAGGFASVGSLKRGLLGAVRAAGVTVAFRTHAVGSIVQRAASRRDDNRDRAGHADRSVTHDSLPVLGAVAVDKAGFIGFSSNAVLSIVHRSSVSDRRHILEYEHVDEGVETIDSAATDGQNLTIVRDPQRAGHAYVSVGVSGSSSAPPPFELMEVHDRALRVAERLRANVPVFARAILTHIGHEPWQPSASDRADVSVDRGDGWIGLTVHGDLHAPGGIERALAAAVREGGSAVDPALSTRSGDSARGPVGATALCSVDHDGRAEVVLNTTTGPEKNAVTLPLAECSPRVVDAKPFDYSAVRFAVPGTVRFPPVAADVVVAGGGTAGAAATVGAAEAGAGVVTVESLPYLGGTGTIGGINRYYYGNRDGFTARVDASVLDAQRRLTHHVEPDEQTSRTRRHNLAWNIVSKHAALGRMASGFGARVALNADVAGVRTEDGRITDLLVAHEGAVVAISASVFVDATGDADLAVSAGVPTVTGDPRGGNVQTYNQCAWTVDEEITGVNLDMGIIDVSHPADLTRALYDAHNRSAGDDFSPYAASRETRHLVGRAIVSLADVMPSRRHPDDIAVTRTDYDQHALQTSFFARMGFLPYHTVEYMAHYPYSASLAEGCRNLIVAGKAASFTRDAFAFYRMQPDQQNIGYALGVAAGLAATRHCRPDQVSTSDIATYTGYDGTLVTPEWMDEPVNARVDDADRLVARLAGGDHSALPYLCCEPSDLVVPLLRVAYSAQADSATEHELADEGVRLIAVALAWYDRDEGARTLVRWIERLAGMPQTSRLDSAGRPHGGIVGEPDDYWKLNQTIAAIGIARIASAGDALAKLVELTDAGAAPNVHERFHWGRVPNYDRIVAIAFACERIGSRTLGEAAASLLGKPYLGGHVVTDIDAGDRNYASALLEIVVARAVARCGVRAGFDVMDSYRDDVRSTLRQHAERELAAVLSGQAPVCEDDVWSRY